tara:strand:- start:826 stop:3573 length:2748 start_codon:yes stop_codon:yes gene_type:complete
MAETTKLKKKRRYNYSAKQKAKIAARRAVKKAEAASQLANKEAAKLRAKAHQLKKRADKKKADKRAVKEALDKGGVLTDEQLATAPPNAQIVLQEDEDIIFRSHPGPQTLFLAAPETEVLYGGAAGGGKILANEGCILTPFGWKKGKDLSVGDLVNNPDGTVQRIIQIKPEVCLEKWTVCFSDGTSTDVAADHLWLSWRGRKGRKINNERTFGEASAEVVETQELKKWLEQGHTPQIPVCRPQSFNRTSKEKNKLDPYLLGVLLGDGCTTQLNNQITCDESDKGHYKGILGEEGVSYVSHNTIRFVGEKNKYLNAKLTLHKLNGLKSKTKFIPEIYKHSSVADRLALIQGLMDTDGWSSPNKSACYFDTISTALAEDTAFVLRSLGAGVTITKGEGSYKDKGGVKVVCNDVYHLYIRYDTPDELFRLKRKQFGSFGKGLVQKSVSAVNVGGTVTGRCVTVSNPNGLYITNDFIVTHNSYAMLADPLRYAHNPNMRALLLRKTMPELIELIDISRVLYLQAFPGAKFQEQKGRWLFPSGATLQFSFVDNDKDVFRFQGQAFTWIGVDELGHYGTPFVWNYLRSRLRRTDQSIIPYMRATANPGGLGGWWIKKMFVDPKDYNQSFWARDIDTGRVLNYPDIEQVPEHLRGKPLFKRRFIPAKLTDNPSLMQSPDYMAMLASLPEVERKRLLEGDWDVSEDAAFPEFNRDIHVIKGFSPPAGWTRFRACDYGYIAHAAVLWFAVDYEGTIHVYKELYQKRLDADQLSERIKEMEADEPRPLTGPLDNESFARRGQVGPTVAETMIKNGVPWQRADKGPGSRKNGKAEVHRMLGHNEELGHPWIQIHDNCVNLARIMPMLPLNENNVEDVDTKFNEDHLYDALRYGIMSRMKRRATHPTEAQYMHQVEQYRPSDEVFGY